MGHLRRTLKTYVIPYNPIQKHPVFLKFIKNLFCIGTHTFFDTTAYLM